MKLSRFSTAFCAVTLLATTAVAQTPEEMKKDLDALKAQVAAQKAELDAMKADKNSAALEASVENEINRLSERLAAATTVNSGANKLTFTGEFRNRSYLEIGDNNAGVERDGWTNDMRVREGRLRLRRTPIPLGLGRQRRRLRHERPRLGHGRQPLPGVGQAREHLQSSRVLVEVGSSRSGPRQPVPVR
jgi:hypothetical protein